MQIHQIHAAVAVANNSSYYARLLRDVREAVVAVDTDLKITVWNHAAEAMYGWSANEALGRSLYDVVKAAISDELIAELIDTLRTAGHQRTEYVHYRRDGQPLFVESTFIALKNDTGEATGYVSVHCDVSERRGAEIQLEQSERRFRALVEHSSDVISLLDTEGAVIYSTPAIAGILGYSAEEFVGINVFDLVHTNDVEALRAVQSHLLSHPGLTAPVLLRARHHNGSWRWIEGLATNLLSEPMVGAIVANYRDITERQQAAEALRLSSERLKVLLDMDEAILAARSTEEIANAALEHLVRLTPCRRASVTLKADEDNQAFVLAVLDTKSGACLPAGTPLSDSMFDSPVLQALQKGEIQLINDVESQTLQSPEMHLLHQNGICAVARVPLLVGGELIGSLNLGSETEQTHEEEFLEIWREVASRLAVAISQSRLHQQVHEGRRQLQALSRRLIEAQEAERRHLACELHDEIGQALTAIKLTLQSVRTQKDETSRTQTLDDCFGIVEDALKRVRNLSLDLRPSLLDDLGLVAALRWYLDRQAVISGLRVRLETSKLSDETSGAARRFAPQIETACFRVVQEAVTNVLRHATAQSVEVVLKYENNVLELEIRDDGQGFDVNEAHERAVGGSSMGLLGMEERVRLAGGDFLLDSAPGHGARVLARIPLNDVPLERRTARRTARALDAQVQI